MPLNCHWFPLSFICATRPAENSQGHQISTHTTEVLLWRLHRRLICIQRLQQREVPDSSPGNADLPSATDTGQRLAFRPEDPDSGPSMPAAEGSVQPCQRQPAAACQKQRGTGGRKGGKAARFSRDSVVDDSHHGFSRFTSSCLACGCCLPDSLRPAAVCRRCTCPVLHMFAENLGQAAGCLGSCRTASLEAGCCNKGLPMKACKGSSTHQQCCTQCRAHP